MTATETTAPERQPAAAHPPVMLYPDAQRLPAARPAAPAFNATKFALVVADLLVIASALVLATWINGEVNATDPTTSSQYLLLSAISLLAWPLILTQQLLYRSRYLGRLIDEVSRVVRAAAIGMLVTGGLSILIKVDVGRQWMLLAGTLVLSLLVTERLIARQLFNRARRKGTLLRPVLIAGRNAEGQLVRQMLEDDPGLGYRFDGFVEDLVETEGGESPLALLGDPTRVMAVLDEHQAASVIIATTAIDVGTSNRLIRALTDAGVHVELSSSLCDIAANRLTIRPVGRVPMMYIEPVRRSGWRATAKRVFDTAAAGVLLVLLAPLLAVAALAIKVSSPGPVVFRQSRVGRDGELFEMIKLRTMVVDAEARLSELGDRNETSGVLFKIKDDPRITGVGRVLRKLSIDELPQLINVLRGEMSLVGPRPALPAEVERWEPTLHNRLRVRPGITGMWQVNGRTEDDHDSRYAQLDLYYVDNWSLITDIAILLRTIPVVIASKGQY